MAPMISPPVQMVAANGPRNHGYHPRDVLGKRFVGSDQSERSGAPNPERALVEVLTGATIARGCCDSVSDTLTRHVRGQSRSQRQLELPDSEGLGAALVQRSSSRWNLPVHEIRAPCDANPGMTPAAVRRQLGAPGIGEVVLPFWGPTQRKAELACSKLTLEMPWPVLNAWTRDHQLATGRPMQPRHRVGWIARSQREEERLVQRVGRGHQVPSSVRP